MSSWATRSGALPGAWPVGIFRTDAEGRCVSVSERWCEISGLLLAETLGEHWARAVHPDDRERVLEDWGRTLRDGSGFETECRLRRSDGRVARVLAQALAERDDRGSISGFIGAIADLSRHSEVASEQLRQLALALALAQERERRRIAAGLHDEIGQILAAARAKLGLLMQSGSRCDVPGAAGAIRALLDRAIAETRALTFELSSPVLYEIGLAASLERLCEGLAEESGVQFRVVAPREPESLGEDLRILLYRAARQLCSNVVRHARAQAADVRLDVDGERIRLVVADDGEGFDACQRAPSFSSAGGYGLFAIREISSHLGGRFEIESAPGKGTRAVLSVPLG